MTKKEQKYFKRLIEEKRKKLLDELGLLESTLNSTTKEASGENSSYSIHMADQGTNAMEREKAFWFASREGNYLYHLDLALHRIDNGDYGVCVNCGKDINRERLEAVPHARLCIACKTMEEQAKT